ncbi:DMT family transporter [Candidatus Woesearchaeota archaeon]|nr:DMT family transporter [Candidatus Woesearchaeota archaeon]
MKNAGLIYAALSSLFLSTGFIFAKHFLEYTNPETLNTLWFGIAFAISITILLAKNSKKTIKTFREHWKDGLIIGGANAIAAGFWFQAINITGPTLTAFLVRFSTIFIIILGIIFLKEKLHIHDIAGMTIALVGAFVISFANGDYLKMGTLVALAASLAIATHQVLSKVYVKKIDPLTLVSIRTIFTAMFLLAYAAAFSKLQPFPISQLPLLFIAIAINAILGFVFFYKALELVDVSKVAIIRTLDPFIVIVYALLISGFHDIPTTREFMGGTLVVAGVLVTMYGHNITTMIRTVKWLPWFG